ncbi:MAG: hypothetical protein HON90_00140 [Halobacteriovoraceae bacterium]|jgi:uncharacterized protein with HEPN domain|nr:hypothetical protein [Halobacteriovoraceae bacterium]
MDHNLKQVLIKEIDKAKKYKITLEHSFTKAQKIQTKSFDQYTIDELDILETLTSRFARSSDILIKKIFRIFESIDLEEKGTIRDLINQAEKKEIIDSADDFIKIRELRNLIAHEYQEDDLNTIFQDVLKFTPTLLRSIDKVISYASKY